MRKYKDTVSFYKGLKDILEAGGADNGDFPTKKERLAYHLAHFHTVKWFYQWDWIPDGEKNGLMEGFLGKHGLKPEREPTTLEEAQNLLVNKYLSAEFSPKLLESIYRVTINRTEGKLWHAKGGSEPIYYPQKQNSLPLEECEERLKTSCFPAQLFLPFKPVPVNNHYEQLSLISE